MREDSQRYLELDALVAAWVGAIFLAIPSIGREWQSVLSCSANGVFVQPPVFVQYDPQFPLLGVLWIPLYVHSTCTYSFFLYVRTYNTVVHTVQHHYSRPDWPTLDH
jgi:hypothetical protein